MIVKNALSQVFSVHTWPSGRFILTIIILLLFLLLSPLPPSPSPLFPCWNSGLIQDILRAVFHFSSAMRKYSLENSVDLKSARTVLSETLFFSFFFLLLFLLFVYLLVCLFVVVVVFVFCCCFVVVVVVVVGLLLGFCCVVVVVWGGGGGSVLWWKSKTVIAVFCGGAQTLSARRVSLCGWTSGECVASIWISNLCFTVFIGRKYSHREQVAEAA